MTIQDATSMCCLCVSGTLRPCTTAYVQFNGKWKSRNRRVWLVQFAIPIRFFKFIFIYFHQRTNSTRKRSDGDENLARCEHCESGSTTFFNGPTAITNGFIVSSVSFEEHKHNRTPHARYYLISSFRFGITFSKQIPSFAWLFLFSSASRRFTTERLQQTDEHTSKI